MAVSQPLASDKLNAPSHSLMHRIMATDPSAPAQSVTVDLNGTMHTSKGRIVNVRTITDTGNILVTDDQIVCNKATAIIVTLPVGVVGQTFDIYGLGAGDVTLACQGGDNINGQATQTIHQRDCITARFIDSNTWIIV